MINHLSQRSLNKKKLLNAYILLNVSTGSENQVLIETRALKNVKEAHVCFGVYDIILKVETNSMNKMKDFVTNKIKKIKNITSILSLFCPSDTYLTEYYSQPYTSFLN